MNITERILILNHLLDATKITQITTFHICVDTKQKTEHYVNSKGIETCAVDMLNHLPDKPNIIMIAHSSKYDCRFLLTYVRRLSPPVDQDNKFIHAKRFFFYKNKDSKQALPITIKPLID